MKERRNLHFWFENRRTGSVKEGHNTWREQERRTLKYTTSRLRKLPELSVIIYVAPVKALTHANLCHRLPF